MKRISNLINAIPQVLFLASFLTPVAQLFVWLKCYSSVYYKYEMKYNEMAALYIEEDYVWVKTLTAFILIMFNICIWIRCFNGVKMKERFAWLGWVMATVGTIFVIYVAYLS